MKLKYIASLILVALCAQQASATVTLDIQTASLRTSGGAIIPNDTTIILVSDTDGFSAAYLNGSGLSQELLGLTLATGNTFGTGGKILNVLGATDLSGSGDFGYNASQVFDLATLGLTGGAGTSGTDLALLWFPGLTGTGAQSLADGQSYGFYRSDSIDGDSGGSFSFNMPSDGFAESIYALDTSLGGGIATSAFNAGGTVGVGAIPEPSRSMLACIGLIALIGRRRRV